MSDGNCVRIGMICFRLHDIFFFLSFFLFFLFFSWSVMMVLTVLYFYQLTTGASVIAKLFEPCETALTKSSLVVVVVVVVVLSAYCMQQYACTSLFLYCFFLCVFFVVGLNCYVDTVLYFISF